jgi:hypothetical protein
LVNALDDRKKKYIKWGVIGGVILIIVILAIVLPISLGGGGNKPEPTPGPPAPIDEGINFYMVQNETKTAYSLSGILIFNDTIKDANKLVEEMVHDKISQLQSTADPQLTKRIGVDWKDTIKFGKNNRLVNKLQYTFDMLDFKVARLELTDADSERFSIPYQEVEKQ